MAWPSGYSWHQHRSRPDDYRREAERLYRLPDRWLAEELLKLAKRALEENPNPERGNRLTTRVLTQTIPEIARRLGAKVPGHMLRHDLANMSPAAFRREVAGDATLEVFDSGLPVDALVAPGLSAVALLDLETIAGNPIATALDRICPPDELNPDILASITLGSSMLYCDRTFASWTPDVRQLDISEIDQDAIDAQTAILFAEADGVSVEEAFQDLVSNRP